MLCIEAAWSLLISKRFKRSRPMQLHLVCTITWLAATVTYSTALHGDLGTRRNVLLIISALLDVFGRSFLVWNVATRALCVLVFHQKLRRAIWFALYAIIILIIASVGGLIPAYIHSDGIYLPNDAGYYIYVAGIILDLVFSIACDTLYLCVIHDCASIHGQLPRRRTILVQLNLVTLVILETVAIILVLTGVDRQFGVHYVCTVLRIRFFVYIIKYTDRIIRARDTVSSHFLDIPPGNALSAGTMQEPGGPQTGDPSGVSEESTVEPDLTAQDIRSSKSMPPRIDIENGPTQRSYRDTDRLSFP
ncbi:hypothetical protein DFS34DRAFT_307095 [Phlyctochytrium arcticum]|nr:hypothetical protein DFS34DRAFT_307095 [Phlyctochytrium arcticum]